MEFRAINVLEIKCKQVVFYSKPVNTESFREEAVARWFVQPQKRDACPISAFPALEKVTGYL
jgi:hypothetical protein